jgi:hypothetical protein
MQRASFTSFVEEAKIEKTLEDISEGQETNISLGSSLKFLINDAEHKIIPVKINQDINSVKVYFDKIIEDLTIDKEKKIDLDSDGFYDIDVTLKSISENETEMFIQSINEKTGLIDSLYLKIKEFEKSSRKQSITIIIILSILIILVAYLFIKTYLTPAIHKRKINAREKPIDVIKDMISEIKDIKDKDYAKRYYERIMHLYKYIDEEDKKELKQKIINIERYIK